MSTLANRAGPFTHTSNSVTRTMLWVVVAMLPATGYGLWLFGWPAVLLFVITLASALAAEAVMLALLGQPVRVRLLDGSALLTEDGKSFPGWRRRRPARRPSSDAHAWWRRRRAG